ncbi:uncharacterized protein CLAFUR5_05181 [Fulvia fulva]|uniref:F-box domain-containing protein n=1 Tax=Passalora fulva TaxID=5499 RepID=A0A9Q8P7K6_PASFU|nr:uncharacterized protein CLAFUR5_05181 [Fulvia fulva]KAK4616709.1 hypothetical protein CLAFUR0_10673 [Fulvia fulva]UJO16245.1 hypothetical protein CLAFUR5_05181 [Fulvia fulva]
MPEMQKTNLMTLPSEIRNKIFNLAFVHRIQQTGALHPVQFRSLPLGRLRFLRTLHISKTLRAELRPLIYGANLFILRQISDRRHPFQSHTTSMNSTYCYSTEYRVFQGYNKEYCFSIEMPPPAIRKLMRNVRMILATSDPLRSLPGSFPNHSDPDIRWEAINRRLDVLRELALLGFKELELLEVHVSVPCTGKAPRLTSPEPTDEFRKWLEAKLGSIDFLGAKLVLEYV